MQSPGFPSADSSQYQPLPRLKRDLPSKPPRKHCATCTIQRSLSPTEEPTLPPSIAPGNQLAYPAGVKRPAKPTPPSRVAPRLYGLNTSEQQPAPPREFLDDLRPQGPTEPVPQYRGPETYPNIDAKVPPPVPVKPSRQRNTMQSPPPPPPENYPPQYRGPETYPKVPPPVPPPVPTKPSRQRNTMQSPPPPPPENYPPQYRGPETYPKVPPPVPPPVPTKPPRQRNPMDSPPPPLPENPLMTVTTRPIPDYYFNVDTVFGLSEVNFDEFVKSHEKTLVMFLQTSSPDSASPAKEFAKASKSASKQRHAFASVDCIEEKQLCCREDANELPMMKLYSNGFTVSSLQYIKDFNADQMKMLVAMAPVLTKPRGSP
ncbi:hypothetical protein BsWGS_16967 [Bradybaena similaris]